MGFALGQEIIDKIRGKERTKAGLDVRPIIDMGCKINSKTITFPNGIKMNWHNRESELYTIKEVYVNKSYNMNSNKKSVFIDIGMNYAITTLYYAAKENVEHIYSFEPFKTTYKRAIENIELNPKYKNKITAYNIGLGNLNKKVTILYDENFAGCMSLTNNRFDPKDPSYRDMFKKEHATEEECIQKGASEVLAPIINDNIDKLIILKIDTEGAEYDILESLDKSNLLNKIDVVFIEFHFKGSGELHERLTKNGFITREETDFIFGVNVRP